MDLLTQNNTNPKYKQEYSLWKDAIDGLVALSSVSSLYFAPVEAVAHSYLNLKLGPLFQELVTGFIDS